MDRFNSREDDLSFLTKEYTEGMIARGQGKLPEDNPYRFSVSSPIVDKHRLSLWNAGWADQDMIQLQEVKQ